MEQLTDDQYVEKNGAVCPFCGSEILEWGSIEIEQRGATQEVSCMACGKCWMDRHELTGYWVVEKDDDYCSLRADGISHEDALAVLAGDMQKKHAYR